MAMLLILDLPRIFITDGSFIFELHSTILLPNMIANKITVRPSVNFAENYEFSMVYNIKSDHILKTVTYKNALPISAKKFAMPFYSWSNERWLAIIICDVCNKEYVCGKHVYVWNKVPIPLCANCIIYHNNMDIYARGDELYYQNNDMVVSLNHANLTLCVVSKKSTDQLYISALNNLRLKDKYACDKCNIGGFCKCRQPQIDCIIDYEIAVKMLVDLLFHSDIANTIITNIIKIRIKFWELLADPINIRRKIRRIHERLCYVCGNIGKRLCAKCKLARYCSYKCQEDNWSEHEKYCKI